MQIATTAPITEPGRSSAIADLQRAAGGVRDPGDAAGAAVHHRIQPVALLLEASQHRAFQRTAARQFHAHRVDEAAVDQDFVVDVWAGRQAAGTDEADHLPLTDLPADFHALG